MNFYGNADKAAHTRAPGKRATGKRPIGNAQPVGGQWKKKKKRKRRRKKNTMRERFMPRVSADHRFSGRARLSRH